MKQSNHLETIALHSHQSEREDAYGSHLSPIYATSTFTFENTEAGRKLFAGEEGGASHTYSRVANPTLEALEYAFKKQETAGLDIDDAEVDALVFSSGMAAITTAMLAVAKGGTIVAQNTLYGCTHQFLREEATALGIDVVFGDDQSTEYFLEALFEAENPDLVYLETIANPTLRMLDVTKIIKAAHEKGALVMIDNTFATPVHFQPFSVGADMVVYSTTKYQNGMGTSLGGVLLSRLDEEGHHDLHVWRKNLGGIASSFDAWLTMQGLKTLPLRMKQHSINAMKIAEFLHKHPKVKKVHYPGFSAKKDVFIDQHLKNGYGGVVSFVVDDYHDAVQVMDSVKLCTRAVSLGHPDTLIQHPASMTHSVVDDESRHTAGIEPGLIRIAVGLEHHEDIIADLEQALNTLN